MKPDNLVALHKQMTGSYVVDAPPLVTNPLDWWALNLIDGQQDRIEALETMVKVFRGCIETGVFPKQGSPCHSKIQELVGARADDAERTS